MIIIARLSKYEEWKNDNQLENKLTLIESWARDGLTQQQIANNLGINVDTLIEYKKKYPDFSEALKKGKEVVDVEVENALKKNAVGFSYVEQVVSIEKEVIYKDGKRIKEISKPVVIEIIRYKQPETAAQIFWLKNRKPDKWKDKVIDSDNEEAITNATDILVKIRKTVDDRYKRN